jgi:hypothetical protein
MYAAWARRAERIERNVDRAASALFAAACGYAAFAWFRFTTSQPLRAAEAAAAFVVAYLLSMRLLRAVKPPARKAPVPIFDVREVEPIEPAEIREAEPVEAPVAGETPAEGTAADEPSAEDPSAKPDDLALVLDDIIAELEPDSRVVRLFDPKSMPTAGELKSRIDRHLDSDSAAAQSHDAAQALHEALAELRRSIR